MNTNPPVYFLNQAGSFTLKDRNRLKCFISLLFQKENKPLEILNYIFCTDEFLLDLNRKYLKHNTLTDIITFELADEGQPTMGEIYISIDRVRENAKTFKIPFKTELHRVIFHGSLHLCGYRDKSKEEQRAMRAKEDEYLNLYFVSRETL